MSRLIDSSNRGMTGIGVLIMFIALVLVGTIAAGLVLDTMGLVEESAQAEADTVESTQGGTTETTLVEIDTQAAWVLGGLVAVALIGKSAKFWTGVGRARTVIPQWITTLKQRAQRGSEEQQGPIDEAIDRYERGEIGHATLEEELERVFEQTHEEESVSALSSDIETIRNEEQ